MGLPATITRNITRRLLVLKKDSPHIFFAVGVVGTVASTVLACRATMKLNETLEDVQKDLIDTEESYAERYQADRVPVTIRDEYISQYHRERQVVYLKGSLKVIKLYAPAAVIGVTSIGLLTGAHVQMNRRNAALMAAYTAVQEAYDKYRERVRAQLGEEREAELHHGIETEIIKIDGKKQEIKIIDGHGTSPYARVFDNSNRRWQPDAELNRFFISCQQTFANDRLQRMGHVFLNEIYDALGFDRTEEGSVVGWLLNGDGDNYIDFSTYLSSGELFVDDMTAHILLDFNVDGLIYNKI